MDPHHWLLDAAVEMRIPLHCLGRSNVGELLNRPGHGRSSREIATLLAEMVDAGEATITARPEMGLDVGCLDAAQICRLVERPIQGFQPCWYGLTKRGGAEWERHAAPDWTRFNKSWWCPRSGGVEAASLALADELLELRPWIDRDCTIMSGSVRRRPLRPWRATYWKTLPEGHRILFRHRQVKDGAREPMPKEAWERWVALRRWRQPR